MIAIVLRSVLMLGLIIFSCRLFALELTDEELESWFEEEGSEPPYVNRGGGEALEFIPPVPDRRTPFSQTVLEITPESLDTGWVSISQCHDELDAVPDAQVVYQFREMRNLTITESSKIDRAWVDGASVQMKNVGWSARLCVELEARVLAKQDSGDYLIRYGPFQRRFLDSYFPMHVAVEVRYPSTLLTLTSTLPTPSEGLMLEEKADHLLIDAWFRGKLVIELHFAKGDKAR